MACACANVKGAFEFAAAPVGDAGVAIPVLDSERLDYLWRGGDQR